VLTLDRCSLAVAADPLSQLLNHMMAKLPFVAILAAFVCGAALVQLALATSDDGAAGSEWCKGDLSVHQ
jgi:hypothetical protein